MAATKDLYPYLSDDARRRTLWIEKALARVSDWSDEDLALAPPDIVAHEPSRGYALLETLLEASNTMSSLVDSVSSRVDWVSR